MGFDSNLFAAIVLLELAIPAVIVLGMGFGLGWLIWG